MKVLNSIKPLAIALALSVAGSAAAANYALPSTVQTYQVLSSPFSFSDNFTFSLDSASSFSGSVSSSSFTFGTFTLPALNLWGLDLNQILNDGSLVSVSGFSSVQTGNAFTFAASSLSSGNYVMTLGRTASNPGGVYSLGATIVAAPVPEPESYAMFLAGLGILGAIARRRSTRV